MVSQVAAPAMSSVRMVDPRSVMWKYSSSAGPIPAAPADGDGGAFVAMRTPFECGPRPDRMAAGGTLQGEATELYGLRQTGRNLSGDRETLVYSRPEKPD